MGEQLLNKVWSSTGEAPSDTKEPLISEHHHAENVGDDYDLFVVVESLRDVDRFEKSNPGPRDS